MKSKKTANTRSTPAIPRSFAYAAVVALSAAGCSEQESNNAIGTQLG